MALIPLNDDELAQLKSYASTQNALDNKNILVTGAGAGIGRAVALACSQAGATVLLLGKTQSHLEAVYDEIEAQNLPTGAVLPLDLSVATKAQMHALADLIAQEFGALHGVIHNAGVLGELAPLEMANVDKFLQTLHINASATFMLTQALLPLLKGKGGRILTTTSGVGMQPRAFWGAYALSKQMVEGLTLLFYEETHRHTDLIFNCINPAATRTNMRAHAYPGEDPDTVKTPKSIAPYYVALMADECDYNGRLVDLSDNR